MLNCHFLQIPLGVLLKTETKYEDMVGIMDHLHQYVPTVTSEYIYEDEESGTQNKVSGDHFHYSLIGKYMIYISMSYMKCILYTKICVGGDQLTAERARGSQRISDNSKTGAERLEGLLPVVEDWHAKMCLLEVCYNKSHMPIKSHIIILFMFSGHLEATIQLLISQ